MLLLLLLLSMLIYLVVIGTHAHARREGTDEFACKEAVRSDGVGCVSGAPHSSVARVLDEELERMRVLIGRVRLGGRSGQVPEQ